MESHWLLLQHPSYWFCIALCVLCPIQWFSITSSPWFTKPPKPVGDGPDYENIAYHLWQGRGFVIDTSDETWREIYASNPSDYALHLQSAPRNLATTARPPLFPVVVAGMYGVLGRNAWGFAGVRLFSATCLALAGALAVWLTAHLLSPPTNRGTPRRKPTWTLVGAGTTLGLVAVNRTLRDYSTDFLTEPLALLLMQVFVVMAVMACTSKSSLSNADAAKGARSYLKRREWCLGWGMGAVWGALILTRSMFVVWLPAIWLLFLIALPYQRLPRIALATLVVLSACGVCSPWWIRNCIVLQRLMPLGTQGPTTLLGGYSDAALAGNGDWQAVPEQQLRQELLEQSDFQSLTSDSQREVVVAQEAARRVRGWFWQHVGDLPGLICRRIYVHWNPYTGASLLWKLPFLIGAIGLIVRRDWAGYWLLGLPIVSTLVVAAFYSTGGRFLVPLYGVLFTVAGLGLSYAFEFISRKVVDIDRG